MRASVREPAGAGDGQLCPPAGRRAVNHHLRKRFGMWRKGAGTRPDLERRPFPTQTAYLRYHLGCTGRHAQVTVARTEGSEMPEYLFPEVERVVYGSAPLVEVICQVRFPADLRIETSPPAEFQQRIRAQFPLLTQHHQAILSGIPAKLAEALQAVLPPPGSTTTWQFSTEDGADTLQLTKDSLTLLSRNYQRWERFHGLFVAPLSALQDLYSPPFFTRVGLRYRDIIQRSKLGLSEMNWSTLLKPHILAEIAQDGFETRTEEALRNVLLKLPDQGAKVRLQHGFAEVEGSPEQVYLIDCDFFVERTEAANVDSALQYFHGNAARFFRWCITDSLHQAMAPLPVP